MNSDLRRKYNVDDRHPAFPRYDRINEVEVKKTNYCIPVSIFAVTLLNTFYVGIAVYLYKTYVHDTFLNDPTDVDNTYDKLKHLIDYACKLPDIKCI